MDITKDLEGQFARTTLAKSTQTQYVKKLAQWIENTASHDLHDMIEHSDQTLAELAQIPSIKHTPTNHHMFISALVAYLTHIYPFIESNEEKVKGHLTQWKEIQKTNWEPMSEHYAKNEPTEQQKEKMMPFEEIIRIRESLPSGSFERLLLCFYTMMEPIRADYFATEIVAGEEDSKEENILIRTPTETRLMVRDFKTKKRHNVIENTLPHSLHIELTLSLEQYPRQYLFVMDDRKTPFTRKLFSNWACRTLTRTLQHPMTLTVMRHLYISEKVKQETPLEELKTIAKKMGHTRDMQRVYDWS